jgi:hypothetical protein
MILASRRAARVNAAAAIHWRLLKASGHTLVPPGPKAESFSLHASVHRPRPDMVATGILRGSACTALLCQEHAHVLSTISERACLLEQVAVLCLVDRRKLGTDELNTVLLQDSALCQLLRNVETSLAAHGGENSVWSLLFKNLHNEHAVRS